jgi:hypothetical protein
MLIIGSRAAKHYIYSFREPKDWDVICTPSEFDTILKENNNIAKHLIFKHAKKWILRMPKLQIEFEIAIPGSSGELLLSKIHSNYCNFNLAPCQYNKFPIKFSGNIFYANPEILFLIKKSHVGYQIHWDKNINDYSYLKTKVKNLDFFSIALEDFTLLRAEEMKLRFSNRKKIDLDMNNDEFFKKTQKAIKRKYPHDLLHKHTCYYDVPIYEKLKHNKNSAKVEESLWNNLSHLDKIKAVREEAMVIALERKIIPAKEKGETWDKISSFRWALMRISTNLTDGFFQQFALDNHIEIMKDIPPFDDMFFSKVKK